MVMENFKQRRKFRLSFHLSACINAVSTRRISVKFNTGVFYENLSRNPNLVNIIQQCWALHTKTKLSFIVAGEIEWRQKRSLRT